MFISLACDQQPHFTTLAHFVAMLGNEVEAVFRDVPMVCNAQGLIGKQMFAIDGCKLPSNASKEWSGMRADFESKAAKMERAVAHLVKAHAEQDASEALYSNDDNQRRHEERALATLRKPARTFLPKDFSFDAEQCRCLCSANQTLKLNSANAIINGRKAIVFTGTPVTCSACPLYSQCLRKPNVTSIRQATFFHGSVAAKLLNTHCRSMRKKIDSNIGRMLYAQRMGLIEPVFSHTQQRGLRRFTLRGKSKVDTQWKLFCIVHNAAQLQRFGNMMAA